MVLMVLCADTVMSLVPSTEPGGLCCSNRVLHSSVKVYVEPLVWFCREPWWYFTVSCELRLQHLNLTGRRTLTHSPVRRVQVSPAVFVCSDPAVVSSHTHESAAETPPPHTHTHTHTDTHTHTHTHTHSFPPSPLTLPCLTLSQVSREKDEKKRWMRAELPLMWQFVAPFSKFKFKQALLTRQHSIKHQ